MRFNQFNLRVQDLEGAKVKVDQNQKLRGDLRIKNQRNRNLKLLPKMMNNL